MATDKNLDGTPPRWEFQFLRAFNDEELAALQRAGQDGWEPVGFAYQGSIAVVLVKRPLAPGRNAG